MRVRACARVCNVKTVQQLEGMAQLPANVTEAVKALWQDSGVKACYARKKEYQLNDSAK